MFVGTYVLAATLKYGGRSDPYIQGKPCSHMPLIALSFWYGRWIYWV
jgi:hypothetical protein